MDGTSRLRAGRQGGWLLLAAGVLTLVNNYLPGSAHLDVTLLDGVGLVTVALGALALRLPWDRLHRRAPLALVPVAFGLITVSDVYGGVSAYSYAVYFVVVFVWVGLAQPPGTSLALAPLVVAAYVVPFLVGDDRPSTAVPSVTVAVPVCLLVGETLSRSLRRLERSHAEVVAQREHEQAVVDVLADGVLVLDAQGRTASCNRCALELLGLDAGSVLGAAPPIAVGADGSPVVTQVGSRWIEALATELVDSGERVVALRDISRQRALDEAKDLFLATTSHELRTPLTAVKGYLHVLQRRWDRLDDGARLAALATIAERTEALVALTDHLLLGARASASRHSAATAPFDLARAVADAVASFDGASARHALVVDTPATPVVAVGDAASARTIVQQLVENAVKYSPSGGEVTVGVSVSGPKAVIEVADRGVGLRGASPASLFTPFFQSAPANTREYGGVGLGLYIVRQLVEAQGGAVTAHDRPGGGAVFRVTLPLLASPAAAQDDAPAASAADAGREPGPAPAATDPRTDADADADAADGRRLAG